MRAFELRDGAILEFDPMDAFEDEGEVLLVSVYTSQPNWSSTYLSC